MRPPWCSSVSRPLQVQSTLSPHSSTGPSDAFASVRLCAPAGRRRLRARTPSPAPPACRPLTRRLREHGHHAARPDPRPVARKPLLAGVVVKRKARLTRNVHVVLSKLTGVPEGTKRSDPSPARTTRSTPQSGSLGRPETESGVTPGHRIA